MMRQRISNKLLLVVAIAPPFFGSRTLSQPFVDYELIELVQILKCLDVAWGTAQGHDFGLR